MSIANGVMLCQRWWLVCSACRDCCISWQEWKRHVLVHRRATGATNTTTEPVRSQQRSQSEGDGSYQAYHEPIYVHILKCSNVFDKRVSVVL